MDGLAREETITNVFAPLSIKLFSEKDPMYRKANRK